MGKRGTERVREKRGVGGAKRLPAHLSPSLQLRSSPTLFPRSCDSLMGKTEDIFLVGCPFYLSDVWLFCLLGLFRTRDRRTNKACAKTPRAKCSVKYIIRAEVLALGGLASRSSESTRCCGQIIQDARLTNGGYHPGCVPALSGKLTSVGILHENFPGPLQATVISLI